MSMFVSLTHARTHSLAFTLGLIHTAQKQRAVAAAFRRVDNSDDEEQAPAEREGRGSDEDSDSDSADEDEGEGEGEAEGQKGRAKGGARTAAPAGRTPAFYELEVCVPPRTHTHIHMHTHT
jgi:hypothetical protein